MNKAAGLKFDQIIPEYTLRRAVEQAIFNHTEFRPDQIISQDNKLKYFDPASPEIAHEYLNEVYQAMVSLNEEGLSSADLGQVNGIGVNFSTALDCACDSIVDELCGSPMIYVELGPEPFKTKHILSELLNRGVEISRYISVDINPASQAHIRQAIGEILPNDRIECVISAFEDFRLSNHVPDNKERALFTTLGFQEGNDDPIIMSDWLSGMIRQNDILLSEVQLYEKSVLSEISNFYAHPLMQRFSRIAFERAVGRNLPSVTRYFLLPVATSNEVVINTAIIGEEFISRADGRLFFVSNFCLKYSLDQYRIHRQRNDQFTILNEYLTGDRSIIFQLSKRN